MPIKAISVGSSAPSSIQSVSASHARNVRRSPESGAEFLYPTRCNQRSETPNGVHNFRCLAPPLYCCRNRNRSWDRRVHAKVLEVIAVWRPEKPRRQTVITSCGYLKCLQNTIYAHPALIESHSAAGSAPKSPSRAKPTWSWHLRQEPRQ